MRPAEDMSVVLNVERELVVLFADYETFEARTLRAFDLIYRQFDDVRVDKSLRFLVSDDINIEKSIHLYLQQNPEYPIVVALHYDKFLEPIADSFLTRFVRITRYVTCSAISRHFGTNTTFSVAENLLKTFWTYTSQAKTADFLGCERAEKTSTIYAIQRRAKTAGCRTVVIDCQDPAVHARRFYSLLDFIVSHTRQELGLKKLSNGLGSLPTKCLITLEGKWGKPLMMRNVAFLLFSTKSRTFLREPRHQSTGERVVIHSYCGKRFDRFSRVQRDLA